MVGLRVVLPPAQQNNPDNLVNKGHRWAFHCWMQDRIVNERHIDKGKIEEREGDGGDG